MCTRLYSHNTLVILGETMLTVTDIIISVTIKGRIPNHILFYQVVHQYTYNVFTI